MTPAARVEAAIQLLDAIAAGKPAEQALTTWGRNARYAGSKDRAAVRDLVFDALRCWRSAAALGGAESGRARMLGLLRGQGQDVEALFSGQGHGPATLTAPERAAGRPPEGAEAWDLPDWLAERFRAGLGPQAAAAALSLRKRAEVFLRVNLLKATPEKALAHLAEDGIMAEPHDLSPTALRVTDGARKIARSAAYQQGEVELQDAASQAVVDKLPLRPGLRVLDYCAGGGGKALAMAARMQGGPVDVHDAAPRRMADLPARAARAGADLRRVNTPKGSYDLILCDAPCSGSGSWRRSPEGKWALTRERLAELSRIQAEILDLASAHVVPGGALAYVTCSILSEENDEQIQNFITRMSGFRVESTHQFLPDSAGDGFFVSLMMRAPRTS